MATFLSWYKTEHSYSHLCAVPWSSLGSPDPSRLLISAHSSALEHLLPQGSPHLEAMPVAGEELPIPKKRFLNKCRSRLFFSWYFLAFPNIDEPRSCKCPSADGGGQGPGWVAAAWTPAYTEPLQVSTCGCSGVFTLERPVCGCCILKAFPHYLDESCLQVIGAEMILFSMLLSILLWITPSVQACECKWIYQFLKYKLKKYACDIKNAIQAPSAAHLLFEIYHWKCRIISKACSKFLKKIPIISSFTSLCVKAILLAFSSEY